MPALVAAAVVSTVRTSPAYPFPLQALGPAVRKTPRSGRSPARGCPLFSCSPNHPAPLARLFCLLVMVSVSQTAVDVLAGALLDSLQACNQVQRRNRASAPTQRQMCAFFSSLQIKADSLE